MRKLFTFLLFTSSTLCLFQANAAVIYSDMGPALAPYFNANGRAVTGSAVGSPGYQQVAVPFTATGNYNVSQIDIALTFSGISGVFGTDGASVVIASNNGGMPGSTLGSWNISGLPSSFTGTTTDAIAVSGVTLTSGLQYWIVATPGASTTDDIWDTNSNPTGVFGNEEINQGSGWVSLTPYDLGAFDVIGTAVPTPEPASSALAIGGFALIAAGWARRRFKA